MWHQSIKLVLKELKKTDTSDADFENERSVLSYLGYLEHPNILPLVTSYTFRNVHTLLFPPAGGDLENFFQGGQAPTEFSSDEEYFVALHGLASAVERVHVYTSQELDIKMIGCHHDIKPSNILLMGNKLVLADFGISRLVEETLDSKTKFKQGGGFYLAPECPNLADGFQKHSVGRASDIWSFGCVLAEIVTFMQGGATELEEFRSRRETAFTVPYAYRTKVFYLGNDLHPEVDSWLTKLDSRASAGQRILVRLIRDMLKPEPGSRPKAPQVAARLRFLAAKATFLCLKDLYLTLISQETGQEILIETKRFEVWGQVVGLTDPDGFWDESHGIRDERLYDTISLIFSNIREELTKKTTSTPRHKSSSEPIFLPLRLLTERLEQLFPDEIVKRLRTQLEHQILHSDDLKALESTRKALAGSYYPDLGLLVAIKYMVVLSRQEEEDSLDLRLDIDSVRLDKYLGSQQLGRVVEDDGKCERPVLIEWIEYGAHWSEEETGSVLYSRVGTISRLHRSIASSSKFRVLRSSGYYHNPSRNAFGVIYDFPLQSTHEGAKPYTLREIIDATVQERLKQPVLGDRFKIASYLTSSLLEIHKVGWLHKSICASNTIFFAFDAETVPVNSLYIVGFNHSRPGEKVAFSEGPQVDSSDWLIRQEYQHPIYRRRGINYSSEFDYYSVGVLLLEIGLWRSITSSLAQMTGLSPEQKQEHMLRELVPYLRSYMGTQYWEAVDYCLRVADTIGGLGERSGDQDTTKVHMDFERHVVEKLARCTA